MMYNSLKQLFLEPFQSVLLNKKWKGREGEKERQKKRDRGINRKEENEKRDTYSQIIN